MKRENPTVENFCNRLHKHILEKFKYALVWGTSPKHYGQRVGLKHLLDDEDVVQVVKSDLHLLEGVGRFSTTKRNDPAKLADRKKKEKLKT